MLIRKLSLRNFRNFKNCDLEFSCDSDKNFTIILGQNTYGKTTLVKSFIWCLYRQNLFDDKILLNSDIADSMTPGDSKEAKVELELEHKGYTYKITTKETYTKSASWNVSVSNRAFSRVVKIDGDNAIPISSSKAEEEIDSILRPELKEYFFFDGETNSIENVSTKKNLTSAVTNILGLNSIEMLRDYYDPTKNESVTSYLRKEIIAVDDAVLDNLNQDLEDQMNKKTELESEIESIEEQIEKLEVQKQNLEDQLDANKDVEQDQKDKKTLDTAIRNNKLSKESSFKRMIQMFNVSNAFLKVLFANSFVKFNLGNLSEESTFKSENSYRGITEQAVDDLIKAGKCLCGTPITNNSDAYNHLIEAKEHMEPRDYGKYLSDFISAEKSNIFSAQTTLENITAESGKVLNLIETIDDDEQRLTSIKKRIEGRADVGEIQTQLNTVTSQISFQQGTLKRIKETDIPSIIEKIDDLNRRIEKSSVKNDTNDFTNKCIDYAMRVYEEADKRLKKSKIEIREKLQVEVGSIFKSMYHGNREIKIDEYFKATTVVTSVGKDKKIDGSTGLGTVVNYSFVAGLMKLAKKSILSGDDIADEENLSETYPLVMDAPFSNTDEDHIKNICNALPDFCDQIVMFVMQKDFNYASASISHKIGKKYRLVKISETEARVDEEVL